MGKTISPAIVTPELRAFFATISDRDAFMVDLHDELDAQPLMCFQNVERAIARKGGSSVLGWTIWMRPGVYVEAEHHALWLPPMHARPLDITPKEEGERRTMFLPDPTATYRDGTLRPNKRHALVDDAVVHRFLAAGDEHDRAKKPLSGGRMEISMATMMPLALALKDLDAKYR